MVTGHPASSGGLFVSLRRLLATAFEMALVRLDLLGTELEIEKQRILAGLLRAAAALLLLGVAAVLACGCVILLLWDSYRLAAMGTLALAFLVGGLWLLRSAQARLRSPGGLFLSSVAELRRDQADLAR